MSSLNKVLLIGRLGKDPEMYHFDSGAMKASFSLATSEAYNNRDGQRVETTEWHNVVMWRKQAELAEKYLRKGKLIFVEGRIRTRSWEDQDGKKRYITEIEAYNFKMLGSRSESEGGGGSYQATATTTTANDFAALQDSTPTPTSTVSNDVDMETDDLPF